MKNENKNTNSCICKCGCVSCSKIQVISSKKKSQNNNIIFDDNLVYSILHHKSLHVYNSKSIVIDKCCGNCLSFHCSECNEQFSIIKLQNPIGRFAIGFDINCLTQFNHIKCKKIVIIPEFPIVLKSFVSLLEHKKIERTSNNENSLICSNCTLNEDLDDDIKENDEICLFDSDEDLMFGNQQNNVIIGKYKEHYFSSF